MIQNLKHHILNVKRYDFVFFGTDEFSVIVLDELKNAGFIPSLVVTAPDARKGRGMRLAQPPIKQWVTNQESRIRDKIKILQPEKLNASFAHKMSNVKCQMFIIASYGKIIPKNILDIPKHGTLNVHPSLLPLFRGPSPIHSQILENSRTTGVTIMLADEKIDHGPILAQRELRLQISDFKFQKLRDELARLGGKLIVDVIPKWIAGNINPREQDHSAATYTKIIKKEDGRINIEKENPEMLYKKFRALNQWPGIYFFKNSIRIKITDAKLKDGKFIIKRIIPEGKKETDYKG